MQSLFVKPLEMLRSCEVAHNLDTHREIKNGEAA
jgi:hypothetical protein